VQVGAGILMVAVCLPWSSPASAFSDGGILPQLAGVVFVILLALYIWQSIRWASSTPSEAENSEATNSGQAGTFGTLLKLIGAIAIIVISAQILIPAVSIMAERIGVPKHIISATLIAFGTSLPELVTAIAAVRRNADSYQHIEPTLVGNESRVLVSDLSGRGNLLSKAEELGLDTTRDEAVQVLQEVKELENQGFAFEGAEASVALRLHRARPDYTPLFKLIDYTTIVEQRQGRGTVAEAMVKIEIEGEIAHTAAEGNGPVNALDEALRKAMRSRYPELDDFHLVDYKVRILDGASGTAATTRVLIDTQCGSQRWSTVGAGTNIIQASWLALVDSIEYGLRIAGTESPVASRDVSETAFAIRK